MTVAMKIKQKAPRSHESCLVTNLVTKQVRYGMSQSKILNAKLNIIGHKKQTSNTKDYAATWSDGYQERKLSRDGKVR